MKIVQEASFGIIPIKKEGEEYQVLLVLHGKGHWAFPKGHANENETPQATAVRELKEETGLQVVVFWEAPPLEEDYFFRKGPILVHKRAKYWIAEVSGSVKLQVEEISASQWLPLDKARDLATFPATQQICIELMQRLL